VVSPSGMDRYPSRFINDQQGSVQVVVEDCDGARGNGGFVAVNGVRNTISILDFVVYACSLTVDFDRAVFDGCFVVFRLTVPEFGAKDLEEGDIVPPQLGPGVVRLLMSTKNKTVWTNIEIWGHPSIRTIKKPVRCVKVLVRWNAKANSVHFRFPSSFAPPCF